MRIKGKITDLSNHRPLPFATIGVKGKSFGSVSDAQGSFSLEIPADSVGANDQVVLTSVGYQPLVIFVREMGNIKQFGLQPSTVLLNEVRVKPVKFKTKTFGRTSHSAFMSTRMISEHNHVSDDLGKEIGTVINIDENCQLKTFNMFVIFNHFLG